MYPYPLLSFPDGSSIGFYEICMLVGVIAAMVLFSLLHWPCATTLLTIRRETKSLKWTAAAFLLPTICGAALCALVALIPV